MNIKILIKNKLELHNIYGFHRKFTINYQLDTERNIHVLSNNALTGGLATCWYSEISSKILCHESPSSDFQTVEKFFPLGVGKKNIEQIVLLSPFNSLKRAVLSLSDLQVYLTQRL